MSSRRGLTKRASEIIIEFPVEKLRAVKNTNGVGALERETQHFAGITSLNGALRIYRSRRWIRVFWVAMLVLCIVFFLVHLINIIMIYAGRPIASQVSFIVSEKGFAFPKITICNFNPIKKSYIRKINETGDFLQEVLQYLIQSTSDVQLLYGTTSEEELVESENALLNYSATHPMFGIKRFFYQGGFTCQETMKMCTFAGRAFDCCKYARPVLTSFGRCQVLNLRNSSYEWMRRQREEGVDSGLQIILDSHLEEQFDGVDYDDPILPNQIENGFWFYIDEPESNTYSGAEGISISPGARVYSTLSTSHYVLLDQSNWGNCSRDWPEGYSDLIHGYPYKYGSKDCLSKCKAQFFAARCGCAPFAYNIDGEHRSCTPLETYRCMRDHIVIHDNGTSHDEFVWPACKECVIECDRWEYVSFNSYGSGFSNNALQWLHSMNRNWTVPHIRANFVTMNVYFRDMFYTEYRQVQAKTLTEILSDMGGSMGLFLGMSVVTCFEIVIYLWKVFWIAVSGRRRKYLHEKKLKEEQEQKATEAAMNTFKRMSVDILEGLKVYDPAPKKKSVAQRMQTALRKKSSILFPVRRRFSSASTASTTTKPRRKDNSREQFMERYYQNRLHGNGMASAEIVDGMGASPSIIELKIDARELNRKLTHAASADDHELPIQITRRHTNQFGAHVEASKPKRSVVAFYLERNSPEGDGKTGNGDQSHESTRKRRRREGDPHDSNV